MSASRFSFAALLTILTILTIALLAPTLPAEAGYCSTAGADTSAFAAIYRGDIMRLSYSQTIKSLPPALRDAIHNAVTKSKKSWNKSSCNQGGDDFPWITVVSPLAWNSYSPGLKNSGSTILDIKFYFYDAPGPSCARYNKQYNYVEIYTESQNGGVPCPAGRIQDSVNSGQAVDGHDLHDLKGEINHELGHAFGLGDVSGYDCIMGSEGYSTYKGTHWHIGTNEPTGTECQELDKLTNNMAEINRECLLFPANCTTPTTLPPDSGGGGSYPGDGFDTYDPLDPLWPPSIDDSEPVPTVTTTEVYCFLDVLGWFCFCADEKGC